VRATPKIFIVFILLLTLFPHVAAVPPAPKWRLSYRGPNYDIYTNTQNPTEHRWVSTPQRVATPAGYKPFSFSRTGDHYTVQTGLIAARLYPGKATFYTPNLSRVLVGRENWFVYQWTGAEWKPVAATLRRYFSSSSHVTDDDSVTVSATWSNYRGSLKIDYHFQERLKHTVTWTPTVAGRYAIVQFWNDTRYDSVLLGNNTTIRWGRDAVVGKSDGLVFRFNHTQPFGIIEDQSSASGLFKEALFTKGRLTRYPGLTVEDGIAYVFYNPSVSDVQEGESIVIDPATYSSNAPIVDGYVRSDGTKYEAYDYLLIRYRQDTGNKWRAYVEWNVSSIPDAATINGANFTYEGLLHEEDATIYAMAFQPSISSGSTIYTDAGDGSVYADFPGFPVVGQNQVVQLSAAAVSDLQSQLAVDWFAIGMRGDIESGGTSYQSRIASSENATATPKPTLTVAYTTVSAPTNDECVSTTRFKEATYGWVNVTVTDLSGVTDLDHVRIQVNTTNDAETFTLQWTQSTGVFTEVSDPSSICTLDISTSVRTNVDTDTDIISFYFSITGGTAGACNVKVTSTDDGGLNDTDVYNNKFAYNLLDIIDIARTYFNTLTTYVADSVSWATTVVQQTFSFFAVTVGWILSWFTRMVSFFTTLISTVHDIFAGVYSVRAGIGDLWAFINFNSWIDFVPVAVFLAWMFDLDRRWRQTGQWVSHFVGDVQMIWWLITLIFGMATTVIETVLSYTYRLIDILVP